MGEGAPLGRGKEGERRKKAVGGRRTEAKEGGS